MLWYRQKSRFWSNSWLSKIAGRAKCQTHFTDDEAEYMTQSATHHWLSIDCWTCELRSDKNSYRRPCSVDGTVGDSPTNVLFVTACSMDEYRVINVWNSFPDVVNFTSLSAFKRSITVVDFHEFLMCNNE